MHFNVSGNFCPHTSSSKSSAPPAATDGFKSPRPQSIVLRQPPTKPGSRGPREQLTPTTLRFAYEAFLGLSQDRAAKAAHAQRKRLPTVASQDCKRESQPTPAGVRRSPRKKNKGRRGGEASKHRSFFFFFFSFLFQSSRVCRGLSGSRRLRARRSLERSLHLSLRSGAGAPPARHLSSRSPDPSGMPSPSPASPGPCHGAAATPRRWGAGGTERFPGTPGWRRS